MSQHYSNPKRETDPRALPDLEVFHVSEREAANRVSHYAYGGESDGLTEAGWYWWPCFPGCVPDGEPSGPFATEAEALADAREGADDGDDDGDGVDPEDGDDDGPESEDYSLSDSGPLGSLTSVGIIGGAHVGTFASDAEALAAIRARMDAEKFWPNVWRMSDHGNWSLIDMRVQS